MERTRNKWCEDLEELLQCPVCMDQPQPNESIFQCNEGHIICEGCKLQLRQCPFCSEKWLATRNRLAEALSSKLEDIKESLIDPSALLNRMLEPITVSVHTQTDLPHSMTNRESTNQQHHGPYPCNVGDCDITTNFKSLIGHIKLAHADYYIELPKFDGMFQHTWKMNAKEPKLILDRVIQIIDVGVFVAKLSTDAFQNFTGTVLMIHDPQHAKLFSYQLEIACCMNEHCRNTTIFNTEVLSCRNLRDALLPDKCMKIKRADIKQMLDHNEELTFTLLLTKNENVVESTKATGTKKKIFKKGNYPGLRSGDSKE